MNKTQKKIITVMVILLIISTGCFGTGVYFRYFNNDDPSKPNKPIPINNTTYSKNLKFKYFLEDEEQPDMTTNTKTVDENNNTIVSDDYIFARYVCTNNIKGEFNSVTWEFIPNSDEEGDCELYFVKSRYEVTVTSPNGTVDNNVQMIKRQEDAAFTIEPNKGYSFKKAECSNGKEAKWDASTKTLKIEAIMNDVTCNVSFELNKLNAKVTAFQDGAKIKEEEKMANYGDPIAIMIAANSGYEVLDNGVTCSNGQTGKWESGLFKIEQLTSSTECQIKFTKKPIKYYTFKITNTNDGAALVGDSTRQMEEGKTFEVKYKRTGDNNITLSCNVKPTTGPNIDGTEVTYTWNNVNSDISCEYKN